MRADREPSWGHRTEAIRMLMDMTVSMARDVLGLSESYGWGQLRRAYARMAFLWHPDMVEGRRACRLDGRPWLGSASPLTEDVRVANMRMATINRAYEVLRSDLFNRTLAGAIG